MKAATSFLLLALATAEAQLTATRVHEVVRHPDHFTGMAVRDLDGDGDDDLLLHGSSNALTVWCRNLGDGTFSRPVVIEMAPRVFNRDIPYLADLEGDGTVDLYTASGTRTRSLGGGNFSPPEAVPGGTWPTPPPLNTFPPVGYPIDSMLLTLPGGPSGKDRLLVYSAGPVADEPVVRIYSLDANGQPVLAPFLAGGVETNPSYPSWAYYNLDLVDAEGDGDMDLIFQDTVTIYRSRGDGTFDAPVEIADIELMDFLPGAYTPVRLPGEALPALVTRESYYVDRDDDGEPDEYLERLSLRFQTESGGQFAYQPESTQFRLDFGDDYPEEIIAVPAADPANGDELWVRRVIYHPYVTPSPRDRLQGFRFLPGTGWQKHADVEIPAKGFGELYPMTLTPGGPRGLALRLGGYGGVNGDSEDKVIWASLDSLRTGTPVWRTLAGPFNSFADFQVADFDHDGQLDLVSPDGYHGLGGPKSGRVHLIHDIEGTREHRVLETDPVEQFAGAAVPPGNRIVIGHADGDLLPDLAVSNGPADRISLLLNLGSRQFSAAQPLVTGSSVLRPLRLAAASLRFFDDTRIFSQAPSPGAPAQPLHDLGIAGSVVFTDMDADGDADVVAAPCPLGDVTGWGKVGPAGNIVSWQFLTASLAAEIQRHPAVPEIGWITPGRVFARVKEGVPGVVSTPLPGPALGATPPGVSEGILWPPLDLDRDGDFDLLALRRPPPEENFYLSDGIQHLVWHENRGTFWQQHSEPLLCPWYGPASYYNAKILPIGHPDKTRLLFGNGSGEVFLLDLAAPVPGGRFGTWLASFGLSGASAGAESDPDHDGLTNLEEALQGSSPIAATSGNFALPVALSSPDGWTFSSALPLAGTGITATAEVTENLTTWTNLPGPPLPLGEISSRHLYRMADAEMPNQPRRFIRLTFTWSHPP